MNEIPPPDWPGPPDSAADSDAARVGAMLGLFAVAPIILIFIFIASFFWSWAAVVLRTWYLVFCAAMFLTPLLVMALRKRYGEASRLALWEEQKKLIPRIRAGEKDFAGVNLCGADLSSLDLSGIKLREAQLERARLSGANVAGADFTGAYLKACNLSRANLAGANLDGSFLMHADLSGTKINQALLGEANLSFVDFSGADLSGLDLSGRKLWHCVFIESGLRGANLSGADLRDAKLEKGPLAEVKSYSGAIMPDGTRTP